MQLAATHRLSLRLALLAALVAAAAALPFGAAAAPPTRTTSETEFTAPDFCTFPIVVHVSARTLEGRVEVDHEVLTLTNPANGRVARQLRASSTHAIEQGDLVRVFTAGLVEHVVGTQGGLLFLDAGITVSLLDENGDTVAERSAGRSDPYSAWRTNVCGYLAGP